MNYEAILPERKIQIATSVLFYQNHGYDLKDIDVNHDDLYFNEESEIYLLFDDIYAELVYSLNLQQELQQSEINSTSDLIEFILKTNINKKV